MAQVSRIAPYYGCSQIKIERLLESDWYIATIRNDCHKFRQCPLSTGQWTMTKLGQCPGLLHMLQNPIMYDTWWGVPATFSVLEASEVKFPILEGFVLPTSQVGRGTCPVMAKCILIPHKCKQIWAIKALLVYLYRRKNLTDLQPQPLPPHCPMDSVHPQDLLNRRVRRQVSDRVCLWSGQGNCGKIGLVERLTLVPSEAKN